jgi:hypothetical protein
METFTCFILKQNGALSIKSIIKLSVIMLTTGKTLGENHLYLITAHMTYVKTGKQELSSVNTRKDA